MLKEVESINEELSACLKKAYNSDKYSKLSSLSKISDAKIIFDNPVIVPCYLLFALAQELGVTKEIYSIIISYKWKFKK